MRSGGSSPHRQPQGKRAWIPGGAAAMGKLLTVAASLALPWSAAATPTAMPPGFSVQTTAAGTYLRAGDQSLYWSDQDVAAGAPICLDECITRWIPLEAPAEAADAGDWSIAERPEGSRQWVYRGKPLYRFVEDTYPGARLGAGRARGWHLMFEPVAVPTGINIESTLLGRVLADHTGRTLYTQRGDAAAAADRPTSGDHWQPLAAPWLAVDRGDWRAIAQPDGTRQWTYQGQPLFTFAADKDPGDLKGHELAGSWTAVVLEPAEPLPSWVTIQQVDLGLVYADQDGMTVYAPVDYKEILAAQVCPADCMEKNWRPLLAEPDDTSMGRWVVMENEAGQRQWSYEGRLLYSHTRDEKPGDMVGNGVGVGYRIGGGWRVILVETGLRRR
jgi:predicted lipoprotein with Yx(FWY)xxD motif